ncbi:MAG TPA: PadR family transcriptional regulator [Bryobacteraceae bacterium]|nr:PadR family transcriptional regulator [Bryobacteraceae bacterium]
MGRSTTVDGQTETLEFLQGTLELLILRSLQLGANHAYGISKLLERHSDREFMVDNGSLYPALQRLLQRGWLTANWKTTSNGRRARFYALTAAGKQHLSTETFRWRRFVSAMTRILAVEE